MFMRKGLFLLLIILTTQTFAQTGVSLKLGVTPWHFVHDFDDLSSPMSLEYSGGINVEQVLFNSSVGVMTGIGYAYSPPGMKYKDLTDQQNPVAVIYEEEINKKYIQVTHHEVTIPLLFVFYNNGFRTGIGGYYSQYFFANNLNDNKYEQLSDYGLKACTGARISKRVIFTIGYYYGLKQSLQISRIPQRSPLSGNMQKLEVHLAISLFNNLNDSKYFLVP